LLKSPAGSSIDRLTDTVDGAAGGQLKCHQCSCPKGSAHCRRRFSARELLSEFCRAQGFEVATAHDGRAAIASIARESDAIWRDHYIFARARADGFEVLRAARDANPSVYVA